jgi:hypothetical protein
MIRKRQIGLFVGTFAMCLAVCTILWEAVVATNVYHCADQGFLEFLDPGQWYHPQYGDTLRAGWTETALWQLWSTMLAASVVIAIAISWMFRRKENQNQLLHRTE